MQYYTSNTANFGLSFIFHMPIPPCLQGNGHIFFFAVYVMAGLRHVAIWFSGEWKASVRGVNVLEGEGRLRQRQQSVLSDQRVCVRGEPGGLTPPPHALSWLKTGQMGTIVHVLVWVHARCKTTCALKHAIFNHHVVLHLFCHFLILLVHVFPSGEF